MGVESSFAQDQSSWVIQKKDDSEFQATMLKKHTHFFTNVEKYNQALTEKLYEAKPLPHFVPQ